MTTPPPIDPPTDDLSAEGDAAEGDADLALTEPPPPYRNPDRDEALQALRAVRARLAETGALLDFREFEAAEQEASEAEEQDLHAIAARLLDDYVTAVPAVPVSRCPFSGDLVWRSVDIGGLDGLWWQYDAVVRPVDPLPANHLAFTGAMTLADEIEATDDLVKPGPGVPFVFPRLLDDEGVVAVLAALPVGAHRGFVIYYFAERPPAGVQRANDWGADRYWFADGVSWDQTFDMDEDHDYELAPWIERGRLRWIHPSDAEFALREGLDGCPFVDLEGTRRPQRIEGGSVR